MPQAQSTSRIPQSDSGTIRDPAATSASGTGTTSSRVHAHHGPPAALSGGHQGPAGETGGEHPVERDRGAAPLDVPEHGDAGLEPGLPLDLGGDDRPDPPESREPVLVQRVVGEVEDPGIGFAPSDTTTIANRRRTAITSRIRRQTNSRSNGCSGSRISVGTARHACRVADPARLTTHDLADHDAVVALGRAVEAVDQLAGDLGRRLEPDARVRPTDVVVDGLRDPDARHPRHLCRRVQRPFAARSRRTRRAGGPSWRPRPAPGHRRSGGVGPRSCRGWSRPSEGCPGRRRS